jgi:hypothetical protein
MMKSAAKSSAFLCAIGHRLTILPRNYFFDVHGGDFQRGINKAIANNWITIDPHKRYHYKLTATGYAAGQIDPLLANR